MRVSLRRFPRSGTVGGGAVEALVAAALVAAAAAGRAAEPGPNDAAEGRAAAANVPVAENAADRPPSPREVMAARGFIRYRGMWRTVQEIELIERADRTNLAQKEWNSRLERLRKRLDDPRQSAAATEEVREIADPHAVPALVAAIHKERMPRVRALYIEALSHVRSGEAVAALVTVAVDHPDPETRILATEKLAANAPETAAAAIVPALVGGDNQRINRAAEALGRLGSAAAVAPLVDVLETDHVVVAGGGAPEGSTTATFTPSGGGLALGGGPKRQKVRVQNQQVLEALVRITGVNFEWNVASWRSWLAGRDCPLDVDLRRG